LEGSGQKISDEKWLVKESAWFGHPSGAHMMVTIFWLIFLQDTIEEVDLISKGGNYGWRVYEGTNVFQPKKPPGGRYTDAKSINPIMPIIEYKHPLGISICGGYVSYSRQDACAYGT
jgi:hypothetical protein